MENHTVGPGPLNVGKFDICRLCMKTQEYYLNIFVSNEEFKMSIGKAIQDLLVIEVSQGDSLPETVCCPCVTKLMELREFREMCIRSARELGNRASMQPITFPVQVEILEDEFLDEGERNKLNEFVDDQESAPSNGTSNSFEENEPDVSMRKSSRIRDHPSTSSSAKQEFGNDPSNSCRGKRKGGAKKGAGTKGKGLGPLKVALFENLTPVKRSIVVCDYCNKSHTSKARLIEHIVLYHQTAVVHKCTICGNVFPTESHLVDHKAIHSSKSKYICSMCDHNCTSRKEVKSHLKEVHDVMNGFVCGTCFLFMPSRAELGLHQACHSAEKKHECSKCGKAWLSKVWYDAHVRSCQLGKVEHKCGVCGKEFKIKGDLTTHSFTHGSVKGFPCKLCPKTFTQSSRLNVHVRNFHLKLKPHECGICGKRFAVKRYLLYHHAVHTDSRPFTCELCGKTFKLKFQVGVHKNKMH